MKTPETKEIIKNLEKLREKYTEKQLLETTRLIARLLEETGEATTIRMNALEEALEDYDVKEINYEILIDATNHLISNYFNKAIEPLRSTSLLFMQVIYMTQHVRYTDSGCMFKFEKEGHNKPFEKAVLEA